ncbi:MAG: chitobiase/beta-hexosaminidase C-terminal domain-containing protein [Saprospirales bacterium]|nr:chitobiase/beta-hexosaminidase C-terminal domain-containing protein [Saprospirales bacterium]
MRKFIYTAIAVFFWHWVVAQSGKSDWTVEVSVPGGFYQTGVEVSLLCPECRLYYTTDGTAPVAGRTGQLYKGPISIQSTSALRILAIKGQEKSRIISHTYFIDEPSSTFPVVSITIPPDILFNPSTGLFVKGPNAVDTIMKQPGANFWSKDEFPINAEIFETDGTCVFRSQMGFRLFGGMSRLFPQKSFAIVARDRYGSTGSTIPFLGKAG